MLHKFQGFYLKNLRLGLIKWIIIPIPDLINKGIHFLWEKFISVSVSTYSTLEASCTFFHTVERGVNE